MLCFQTVSWDYYYCLINFHSSLAVPSQGEVREIMCHWKSWGWSEELIVWWGWIVFVPNICGDLVLELYSGECLTRFDLVFLRRLWRVLLFSILDTLSIWLFLEHLTLLALHTLLFSGCPYSFSRNCLSVLFSLLALTLPGSRSHDFPFRFLRQSPD